jgi:hypothetical protein
MRRESVPLELPQQSLAVSRLPLIANFPTFRRHLQSAALQITSAS